MTLKPLMLILCPIAEDFGWLDGDPGLGRCPAEEFLESGDDRGPLGFLKQRNLEANENPTHWFAVFRPTSARDSDV